MATCKDCAGTGEKFDRDSQDWTYPLEECPTCNGTGENGKCPQFEHVPNRTGNCIVCGYEVLTEVDDDGTPKLD